MSKIEDFNYILEIYEAYMITRRNLRGGILNWKLLWVIGFIYEKTQINSY